MLFTKAAQLDILRCDTCHGSGMQGLRRCSTCHGLGRVRNVRDRMLYWGAPLTRYRIALRRSRRVFDQLKMAVALLIAFGFWGWFAWYVYRADAVDAMLQIGFWFETPATITVLFWLGVLFFCFFLYRTAQMYTPVPLVEHRGFKGQPADEPARQAIHWQDVLQAPRRKRRDISKTYTAEARVVLEEAYRVADEANNQHVTAWHVFYALLGDTKISGVFVRLGLPASALQKKLAEGFGKDDVSRAPRISSDVEQILFQAYEVAYRAKQEYVHVTELIVATVRQNEQLQELLYDLNVDQNKLRNVVEWLRIRETLRRSHQKLQRAASHRNKHGLDRAMTAVATPYLNSFSHDVTMAATVGQLQPCVARSKEIEGVFRIIEGGRQSVVLVGESGVGKQSIIEGIAQRMVEDDVPARLQDKRLVQLSTSALLAGTTVSGAQERLLRIMHEIARAKNIILFIHNIHDLVGAAGQDGGDGLDVSETLAEYLGPGRFLTFATTTTEGYNRHIANSELGGVLGRVDIAEMDENQTIQVLEANVGLIEYRHRVFFSYDALQKAAQLAGKFLYNQRLPESAIGILTEAGSYTRNKKGENHLVSGDDVAAIVADKTGIPVTSITADESEKLMQLEEAMHKHVVGQNEAVDEVANALRRARADMRAQDRPIANFLFLGPTGVGKTELAKTIARVYFGGTERMIRLDMSEYQDQNSVYRLIGQPGQKGTGQLTEAVRQQPFSLILLDELEKANKDVLNIFLQVFDDGRLTDSVGRVIDFSNTIIIATSNAGTQFVEDQRQAGVETAEIRDQLIRGELKEYYRPEFLNRFDGIVLFTSLNREEIKQIARLMLKRVEKDLEDRGVFLRVEDAALEALAESGFDPQFGARPMRRAIQDTVENQLAELILQKKLDRRDTVVIGEGAEISVERAK